MWKVLSKILGNCFLQCIWSFRWLEELLMYRVALKRKLTQRGELYVVWICTVRISALEKVAPWGFGLESHELNGKLSTFRIIGVAGLKCFHFFVAPFSAFSYWHPRCCRLWQLKRDCVCEAKPGIWSKPNLRQMGWCTCCYMHMCVCEKICVYSMNPQFLVLLNK